DRRRRTRSSGSGAVAACALQKTRRVNARDEVGTCAPFSAVKIRRCARSAAARMRPEAFPDAASTVYILRRYLHDIGCAEPAAQL
ncbi:hypothetical protein, partial [Bradyrhizobium sp. STM 3843]|uniref:hypothetical protein n=1 Tax=Bradyrhizobium sp. STM 3843 TaxID=551947 RepID=UPI001AEC38AE